MQLVVEIAATLLAGTAGVVGGGALVVTRRLRRANRLAPATRGASPAPTTWLWSFRRAAVLHRRLQGVCELARQASVPAVAPPRRRRLRARPTTLPSPLERIAGELTEQAVTLDGRLVAADRLGSRWRRPAMAAIEADVRALEASAARLARLSAAWRQRLDEATRIPPADLERQLDAMEAALAELRA